MKKFLFLILPLFFFFGCNPSLIRLYSDSGKTITPVSLRQASGNYFVPVSMSDSLKELWHKDLHGGLTNTSAALFNEYIFISDLSGWITCLDLKTGKTKGVLKSQGGSYSSPIFHKSVLIYSVAEYNEDYSMLYYYDVLKGSEVNKVKIKGKITGELAFNGESVFLVTENGTVMKYDLMGNKIWEYESDVETYGSPAVNNGSVVIGNSKGEIISLSCDSAKVLLRKKIAPGIYGNPSVSGDTVYIGGENGILYALELKSGKIIWHYQTGSKILCSPVFNDDEIYTVNLGGSISALNKTSGKLRWKINPGGVLNATPLLTNNYLAVPDLDGKFYLINTVDGKIDISIATKGRCKISPVLIGNKLLIGYDYNSVAVYEIIK